VKKTRKFSKDFQQPTTTVGYEQGLRRLFLLYCNSCFTNWRYLLRLLKNNECFAIQNITTSNFQITKTNWPCAMSCANLFNFCNQ